MAHGFRRARDIDVGEWNYLGSHEVSLWHYVVLNCAVYLAQQYRYPERNCWCGISSSYLILFLYHHIREYLHWETMPTVAHALDARPS